MTLRCFPRKALGKSGVEARERLTGAGHEKLAGSLLPGLQVPSGEAEGILTAAGAGSPEAGDQAAVDPPPPQPGRLRPQCLSVEGMGRPERIATRSPGSTPNRRPGRGEEGAGDPATRRRTRRR